MATETKRMDAMDLIFGMDRGCHLQMIMAGLERLDIRELDQVSDRVVELVQFKYDKEKESK